MTDPATPRAEDGTPTPFSDLVLLNAKKLKKEERRKKGRRASPPVKAVQNLLALFRAPLVQTVLDGAETVTQFTTDRRILQGLLNVFPPAKEFLRGFPAFSGHLAGVEEAERALENVIKAVGEEDYTTPEQGQTALLSMRAVVRAMDNALAALEAEAEAAKERATHARKVRADRRADLAAAPEDEREKIAAAIEEARTLKASVEERAYETIRGTTNVPLEPLGNSLARGQTSTPAVVVPGPENALEFRTREAEERAATAALEKRSREVTLTGEEVLGPVERQVWRAILVQAARVRNPADLVGVSVEAYAAANGLTYSGAKKAIEKAVDNLFALCLRLGDSYAAERGLPSRVRFLDAVYGERKKLVEGYYLVQLGTTIIKHLAGGRAIQFPLFPALDFQGNPNADLFIQLFSINKAQNLTKSNENIVAVQRLAQAAGLLRGESKNRYRAKEIVERDLLAAEKCGRGQLLAPFKCHRYRSEGKRISTAKALALPPREWLKLTVEVEWNDGALNFERKEKAIRARQERLAIEEAKATIRKESKK